MAFQYSRFVIALLSALSLASTSFADSAIPSAAFQISQVKPNTSLPVVAAEQFFTQIQTGLEGPQLMKVLKSVFQRKSDHQQLDQLAKNWGQGKFYVENLKRKKDDISFHLPDGRKIKIDFNRFDAGEVLLNGTQLHLGQTPSMKELLAQISRALEPRRSSDLFSRALFLTLPRAQAMWHIFIAPGILATLGVSIMAYQSHRRMTPARRADDQAWAIEKLLWTCETDLADPGTYPSPTESNLAEISKLANKVDPKVSAEKSCRGAFLTYVYLDFPTREDETEVESSASRFCSLSEKFHLCAQELQAKRRSAHGQGPRPTHDPSRTRE